MKKSLGADNIAKKMFQSYNKIYFPVASGTEAKLKKKEKKRIRNLAKIKKSIIKVRFGTLSTEINSHPQL